ncbi:hypothetical protein [Phocaeicola sartorii]|jgi:hypothetical protein|uniref:hypothetical protein n=1 Tax=Phocaeicola sartorii TaxID=671267 RepID=UPI0013630116|nr:hypothetical protein [Phocaeicola sartorii]NBJ04380.1 hypothetical protein [Lachnospiraceae bacterium]
MSITKSYNKQTDTYYAYETTYEWSDEKQKKVQRKRCIGKFDPDTGKVIPNGKVGRPSLSRLPRTSAKSDTPRNELLDISPDDIKKLTARLNKIEEALQALSVEIHDLRVEVESLPARNTQES